MPTVSDLTTTTLSGLNHIDALLDDGPDWNYLTPVGNTLLYTFSITTGNEDSRTGQQVFSAAQQAVARDALTNYLSKLTGINFVETTNGAAAQIHLCNLDIASASTTGLCSWQSSYSYMPGSNELTSVNAQAYVYLDNREFGAENANLAPGGAGYETLLHELGHALGLKHPFEGDVHLPVAQDTTANSLMSYTDAGGPYRTFRDYDIAALNWIYGGDGLRGALGIGSVSGARYVTGTNGVDLLTGTQFNDTLEGDGGNDMINGGDGIDTAVFRSDRHSYTFAEQANGTLLASGADGTDTLTSVEILHFSDGSYERAQLADSTPPVAPTLSVAKNSAGYALSNAPFIVGIAEANATVKVYSGSKVIGTAQADVQGYWSLTTSPFADGNDYLIFAKATDAAGNQSDASTSVSFNIDAHAPTTPTGKAVVSPGNNEPVFSGSGEAGTTLRLLNGATVIGQTSVAADGSWTIQSSPLSNGNYDVTVVSTDKAENATNANAKLVFSISSTLNIAGTTAKDTLTPSDGNNAIDGQEGTDTAVYTSARAGFTVAKDVNGFLVTDNVGRNGHDSLVNVERIQFSDGMLALDVHGVAGQAFRLYQAAFDRQPEQQGLGFWIKFMDAGMSVNEAAAQFMASAEFKGLYGSNPTDEAFVSRLYANVLHRAPEQSGFDFWMKALKVDHHSRAEVLGFFSESPENQVQVIGSIENGFAYIPYA